MPAKAVKDSILALAIAIPNFPKRTRACRSGMPRSSIGFIVVCPSLVSKKSARFIILFQLEIDKLELLHTVNHLHQIGQAVLSAVALPSAQSK